MDHLAEGEQQGASKLHVCLPITLSTTGPSAPPHPQPASWKNCLPQNQALVPKRLGTAVLVHRLNYSPSSPSNDEAYVKEENT